MTRPQVWDTLQAFASNITGALATRAVLSGMGVGDAEATPLAATITWLLKVCSRRRSLLAYFVPARVRL